MKAIALAANYAYLDKAETTIKSIIYNNKDVKIYLFNYDIPQEWFININQYVNQIGSEIIDEKFNPNLVKNVHVSRKHINKMSYARFLIPKMIREDRVLYLDSDIVVDGQLEDLFTKSFNGKDLLAVFDMYNGNAHPDPLKDEFNSGVIVFNNKVLKKTDITPKLLKLGNNQELNNGDQTVINQFFRGKIGILPYKYNYQIGFDSAAYWNHNVSLMEMLDSIKMPIIIHYVMKNKPFDLLSTGRMRNKWWFYRNLEWPQIIQKYTIFDLTKIGTQAFDGQVFIFTNSENIQNLTELVKKLPNIRFNIAAYTELGWKLIESMKYPNVKLYKSIIGINQKLLISTADIYLDINYGKKSPEIINQIQKRNVPILSFASVAVDTHSYRNYTVFDDSQVDEMVKKIKEIIAKKKSRN